jgi:cell division protein FtsQ
MAARETKRRGGIRWKLWLSVAGLVFAGVSTGMAARRVREFALTDPQFLLSHEKKNAFTIEGLKYTSRWKVSRVFSGDFNRSIFAIPLDERRRRLLAIDWVEDASVSRIWPDRLVVRIKERRPVAFVLLGRGVFLIDKDGVLLDPPPQSPFTFPVLSGIREEETEPQRRERVRCFLNVEEDLGTLSKDISEVNTADCDDVRIVTKVNRKAVELIMGDGNYAERYSNFLKNYPEIEKRSPGAKTFDLRLDDRIAAQD